MGFADLVKGRSVAAPVTNSKDPIAKFKNAIDGQIELINILKSGGSLDRGQKGACWFKLSGSGYKTKFFRTPLEVAGGSNTGWYAAGETLDDVVEFYQSVLAEAVKGDKALVKALEAKAEKDREEANDRLGKFRGRK